MAWRTDISVLLFVVIALAKGNLNVIGEWNLYGSLTPNHNSHQITPQANYRYQINHIKAAAPPTVPPRKDRTNARLSGAPVVQFSASKSNDPMVSSFSAASPQMGPTQAQIDSLNAFKNALGSQKMVLIDKHMGQVQIQPGSFSDRVVIRDPARAITYSKPYSVSHRKLTPWQQPPSTPPPTMPAEARPQIIIATSPPVKPRFQFTMADGLKVRRGNAQGAGGRGGHPPNHGPPPGPIYPANPPPAHHAAPPPARHAAPPPARHAVPPQAHYNPPPPSWNPPPRHTQNQWNQPPPQQYYQNHPPTHPPRYLPPPTHPPRHYFPPQRRARPTPAPYRPPATTKPTTTTTTTTKRPEIEYDIEGPRTTQAPPPTRTRPTVRPKCDYWSMDQFGNLQFFPCQRPIFRPPTTTPAPAPMFYFYDVATQDPWKWYDYPNEVKIEVKVERDKRTK